MEIIPIKEVNSVNVLKCTHCKSNLKVEVGYSFAEHESVAGKNTGFNCEIFLECVSCPNIYRVGFVKDEQNFSKILSD